MSRASGCVVILTVTTVAVGVVFAAVPDAGVIGTWVIGTGALWWSMYKTSNPASPVKEPVPYPTELGLEDYISAGGGYLFRKRAAPLSGYDVVQLKAPVDADTSPGRAD